MCRTGCKNKRLLSYCIVRHPQPKPTVRSCPVVAPTVDRDLMCIACHQQPKPRHHVENGPVTSCITHTRTQPSALPYRCAGVFRLPIMCACQSCVLARCRRFLIPQGTHMVGWAAVHDRGGGRKLHSVRLCSSHPSHTPRGPQHHRQVRSAQNRDPGPLEFPRFQVYDSYDRLYDCIKDFHTIAQSSPVTVPFTCQEGPCIWCHDCAAQRSNVS